MIITSINEETKIAVTIKDCKVVKLEKPRSQFSDRLDVVVDGEIIISEATSSNAIEIFKTLSTKLEADAHYCIVKENNKYKVTPYSADKL